jgi:hypothetical protein
MLKNVVLVMIPIVLFCSCRNSKQDDSEEVGDKKNGD